MAIIWFVSERNTGCLLSKQKRTAKCLTRPRIWRGCGVMDDRGPQERKGKTRTGLVEAVRVCKRSITPGRRKLRLRLDGRGLSHWEAFVIDAALHGLPVLPRVKIVAAFVGLLIFFNRDAVSIGEGVVADSRDLPGHLDVWPVGLDHETVAVNLASDARLSELRLVQ